MEIETQEGMPRFPILNQLVSPRWNSKIVESEKWRKSSQFFVLRRSHAQLAAKDTELQSKFEEYCFTSFKPIRNLCIADEHYFPTLLAYHDLDNQVFLFFSSWIEQHALQPCRRIVRGM